MAIPLPHRQPFNPAPWIAFGLFAFFFLMIPGCMAMISYNGLVRHDLTVDQAHARLNSVYQKRADLIDNLANTVKGYASHEEGIQTKVAEARGGVGKVTLPANATPEDLSRFAQAQQALGAGLGRLLAVAEAYPNLKADRNFLALQKDLRSIETQATAARNVYISAVRDYNLNVKTFPRSLFAGLFGFTVKPQLAFENEEGNRRSPRVDFKR